jgi:sec-independent protein translocase protein TatC
MGVVDPYMLSQKRPYVILWAFIVAAVITPPDIFSQFFLAVPMILLFEVGLFFARRIKRAANAAENGGKDNLTDNEIEDEMKKLGAAFPKRTKRGRRKK